MSRLQRYTWLVVAYNLAVILWGAYVRASGSGAGCGSHWPLCNGQMVPRSASIATAIEFSHRVTSGLALLSVVVLAVWAFRVAPRKHPVRLGASLSLLFMLTEAAVGAGLVLFQLVAHDASVARALFVAVHLCNTFLLLGAMALTAHWAGGGARIRLRRDRLTFELLAGCVALLAVGASGAVAALGDTLFPAHSLAHGLAQDAAPTASFLIRLRILHPLIAIGAGLWLLYAGQRARQERPLPAVKSWARWTTALVFVQWMVGIANVGLLAPLALQMVHLLLADLVWIATVLLAAVALAERR
jgi:cytochrome c oxidase assembly protein subunit 15